MGLTIYPAGGGGGGVAENTAVTFKSLTLASPDANTPLIAGSGFSLTGSNAQSLVDLAGTWNTSGTPTALKLNITDTASNSASLLMDLQIGSSSVWKVSKKGAISSTAGSSQVWTYGPDASDAYAFTVKLNGTQKLSLNNAGQLGATAFYISDLWMTRPSSNTLQLGTDHATAASEQTIKGPNTTTGVGGALRLQGGTGGGSAGGSVGFNDSLGNIIFEVSDMGLGFFGQAPVAQAAATTAASVSHAVASGSDSVDLTDLNQNLNNLGSAINEIRVLISNYGLSL